MLSKGASSTIFESLVWFNWIWTLVSRATGEHFHHYANGPVEVSWSTEVKDYPKPSFQLSQYYHKCRGGLYNLTIRLTGYKIPNILTNKEEDNAVSILFFFYSGDSKVLQYFSEVNHSLEDSNSLTWQGSEGEKPF